MLADKSLELDLSVCDREPIHIPGAIQPHGVLLTLDGEARICRAAGDVQAQLGYADDPIGKPWAELFDSAALPSAAYPAQAEFIGPIEQRGRSLDVFAHRSGDELIVELEPAPVRRRTGAEVLRDLLPIVSAIGEAADLGEATRAAAAGVRLITGYDRVMIYHFLEDQSGQVVAEDRAADVAPFLNHRYPASDIPQQARVLYLRNPIRLIPDVFYEPAPIRGGGGGPLDLGGALLRSVSPIHIQYLKNMEVGASASISIITEGALWGLIACHNRTQRSIAHEEREMCRRVGLALQQAIARLEDENTHREALKLTRRREELLPIIAAADSVAAGLCANQNDIQRLLSADGLALLLETDVVTSGATPAREAIGDLARSLLSDLGQDPIATNELASLYPPAAEWAALGSGLLAAVVSRNPLIALLWFRAEEVETINWAGNPHKAATPGVAGQLNPRSSFALWAEAVRGRSRPWRPNEVEAARRIAAGLAEIGRQKAMTELNRQLTSEIAEKDLLMREVNHRVQNSLQLVTSMLQLHESEVNDEAAREQLALARDRVLSVALLHRRLWRSEDLQNINLETFFDELVEGLLRTWKGEWRSQVTLDVEPVLLPAHDALLIALIVSELLTNAVKHAYGGRAGPLSLTVREIAKGGVEIRVADRGVGSKFERRSTSFGSRLVQRLLSSIHGELKVLPNDPGTCVTLTLPAAHS